MLPLVTQSRFIKMNELTQHGNAYLKQPDVINFEAVTTHLRFYSLRIRLIQKATLVQKGIDPASWSTINAWLRELKRSSVYSINLVYRPSNGVSDKGKTNRRSFRRLNWRIVTRSATQHQEWEVISIE